MKALLYFGCIILTLNCHAQSDSQLKELEKMEKNVIQSLEQGKPDLIPKANSLLSKSKEFKSVEYQIKALNFLGIANKDKGYYVTSLNYLLDAIELANQTGERERLSNLQNNIGSIHFLQKNYEDALELFQSSLEIEDSLLNQKNIGKDAKKKHQAQKSIRLYNLAEVYKDMDSLDAALSYFTSSLLIEQGLGYEEGIDYAYLGIADVYLRMKMLPDAERTLNNIGLLKDHQVEEKVLFNVLKGRLEISKGNGSAAAGILNSTLKVAEKNGIKRLLPEIYENLIEAYRKAGEWEMATNSFYKYSILKEELNSAAVQSQLMDLNFQHKLEQKQLEISLLQEERDLAQKSAQDLKDIGNYESRIRWFLILSLLVLVAIVVGGIRYISKR